MLQAHSLKRLRSGLKPSGESFRNFETVFNELNQAWSIPCRFKLPFEAPLKPPLKSL